MAFSLKYLKLKIRNTCYFVFIKLKILNYEVSVTSTLYYDMISSFRTSLSVLECPFPVLGCPFLF